MSKEQLKAAGQRIDKAVSARIHNLELKLADLNKQMNDWQEVARNAAAQGDRSENAELQIANDKISTLIITIMSLTNTVDQYKKYRQYYTITGKVALGSTLKIRDLTNNLDSVYIKIYPEGLSYAQDGAVTVVTPLGAAVLGKVAGEEVVVKAPMGDILYKIEEVL